MIPLPAGAHDKKAPEYCYLNIRELFFTAQFSGDCSIKAVLFAGCLPIRNRQDPLY